MDHLEYSDAFKEDRGAMVSVGTVVQHLFPSDTCFVVRRSVV